MIYRLSLLLSLSLNCLSNQTDREPLIYNGGDAYIEDYSYAVFLYLQAMRLRSCGGSLIMVQAVITAAHCVNELTHVGGRIDAMFGNTIPWYSNIRRHVIDYKIHPKYNKRRGQANVGIAFLNSRVPLRNGQIPYIEKIPLAQDPISGNTHTYAFSVSWGKQVKKIPDISDRRHLKVTKQLILDHNACFKVTNLPTHALCTRPDIGNFYTDDAGNGLVIYAPSRQLVGVLSHMDNRTAIFVDIQQIRTWIIESLTDLYKENCKRKGKLKCKTAHVTDVYGSYIEAANCSVPLA